MCRSLSERDLCVTRNKYRHNHFWVRSQNFYGGVCVWCCSSRFDWSPAPLLFRHVCPLNPPPLNDECQMTAIRMLQKDCWCDVHNSFLLDWRVLFQSSVGELLGQSPRHVFVSGLDLGVVSTGVGELITGVGFVQVPPYSLHVRWDVIVTILLSNDLKQKENMCKPFQREVTLINLIKVVKKKKNQTSIKNQSFCQWHSKSHLFGLKKIVRKQRINRISPQNSHKSSK